MAAMNVDIKDWTETCSRCAERVKLAAIKLHKNGNVTLNVRCPACESEQAVELMRIGSHEALRPR